MATGGQCEPGHLAGIHPEGRLANPAQEGARVGVRCSRTLTVLPGGAVGPGLWWTVGTSPMPVIAAPPCAQSFTGAHTRTLIPRRMHTRARPPHTHRPRQATGPQTAAQEGGAVNGPSVSLLQAARRGVLVQPLLPDWGLAHLSGPPPTPAAWPGPLSLWVPAPGAASSALCKAGPSVSSKPILEGRFARCTCPHPAPASAPVWTP